MELLGFFRDRLAPRAERPADSLSYANRRRLEIARALATEPRLLLLDEPAAGMNPSETRELMGDILRISERGITILLIEHDMRLVRGICNRVVALDHGIKIAEGDFATVQSHPAVLEAYLGKRAAMPSRPMLELQDVVTYYGPIPALKGISLDVARGRDRLPARRQRVRQVDHHEDHPGRGPPASRQRRVSRATGSTACRPRRSSGAASRWCPRRAACSAA